MFCCSVPFHSNQYRILASGATDWELFFPVSWLRRQPNEKSFCSCHYTGRTIRGKVFETSERDGVHSPLEVQASALTEPVEKLHLILSYTQVSGVIPGWREALMLMREGMLREDTTVCALLLLFTSLILCTYSATGDRFEVIIPSALGFGTRPLSHKHLQPEPVLVFDIELVKVREESDEFTILQHIYVLYENKPLTFIAAGASHPAL